MFAKEQPVHTASTQKTAPRYVDLTCTLEELFHGARKQYVVERTHTDEYGAASRSTETLSVDVKPGWKAGTKLTYAGRGNSSFNYAAGDVVLVIAEAPHPVFRRAGNDLLLTASVTLQQAQEGFALDVLDMATGSRQRVRVEPLESSAELLTLEALGMPLSKSPSQRGDLIIDFIVTFE